MCSRHDYYRNRSQWPKMAHDTSPSQDAPHTKFVISTSDYIEDMAQTGKHYWQTERIEQIFSPQNRSETSRWLINNIIITTLDQTSTEATGGQKYILLAKSLPYILLNCLNAFYWYQNLTLVLLLNTKMFSSHGGFLTNAMYHHRETV